MSCSQCGCSDIDRDQARGDAVCTGCGFVLEESIIVSEVTFEEDGHGGASAVGQFVSADSRGGGILSHSITGFHTGIGRESRELTLRAAKKKIKEVGEQIRLNQNCTEMAGNFFNMALYKQLTKGRKTSLTIAACIYIACRVQQTPHLLIDFSDVLQIDVYALGRAYMHIARSLCIKIPVFDPCLYIIRYAHKFDLGDKTNQVATTASRLVARMVKDWIHLGRRPSGVCGAALLISARLHNFSRSVQDVIRVVKVHETTLRKRLVEFGETPSSSLTLDEFMAVDLEEAHDPPSFKAARLKDRERLQKLLDAESVGEEFRAIQSKIEDELDKRRRKVMNKSRSSSPNPESFSVDVSPMKEKDDEKRFIHESTLSTINSLITSNVDKKDEKLVRSSHSPVTINSDNEHESSDGKKDIDRMLMPPPQSMTNCVSIVANDLDIELEDNSNTDISLIEDDLAEIEDGELDLDGIDDDEINGYIMNSQEVRKKTALWEQINADYIILQKQKQEQLERDIKEGKLVKKKKKAVKAKPTFQATSANEAIKIMLTERKISSKINYDVLKTLDLGDKVGSVSATPTVPADEGRFTVIESGPIIPPNRGGSSRTKRKADDPQENAGPSASKKSKASRKRCKSEANDQTATVAQTDFISEEISSPIKVVKKLEPDTDKTYESEEEVVVESGPVKFVNDDGVVVESGPVCGNENGNEVTEETNEVHYMEDDEDSDDAGEEDEEKEEHMSMEKLLKQYRGEEENDFEEDYY